jgi:hypothetical protein
MPDLSPSYQAEKVHCHYMKTFTHTLEEHIEIASHFKTNNLFKYVT